MIELFSYREETLIRQLLSSFPIYTLSLNEDQPFVWLVVFHFDCSTLACILCLKTLKTSIHIALLLQYVLSHVLYPETEIG